MNPSVYQYKEKENQFELFLGEFSTLDGLNAMDENLQVHLVSIGATSYKQYGWATKKHFPVWRTVQEVKSFLETAGEFGLIDFQIELTGFGSLGTHNDEACHFRFKEKGDLINMIKKVTDLHHQDTVVAGLLNNPETYIEITGIGNLNKYPSLEQYLKETKSK